MASACATAGAAGTGAASVSVDACRAVDEAAFEAFAASQPHGTLYAAPAFHRFIGAAAGGEQHYLLARRGGALAGALAYFVGRCDAGTLVNSLPWYGSHGGCILPADDEVRRVLLQAYAGQLQRLRPVSATLVLTPEEMDRAELYRDVLQPDAQDERIGQVSALPSTDADVDAALFAAMNGKTRNLVRKSLRQGFVECVSDDDDAWRFLHAVHARNMQGLGGAAKPWEHFTALRAALPARMRRLSLACLDGRPVAALLLLAFNRTVEYVTPVALAEERSRQPLSFLIWHGMRWAAAGGYRWWNWGGTWKTQDSLHHFKAGWGALDRPYRYLVNAGPGGVAAIVAQRQALRAGLPYYYLYPFDRLPS
ncbi:MAG: GNAT family N-acetyltransferase [Gammaproteobacteria bacterium]